MLCFHFLVWFALLRIWLLVASCDSAEMKDLCNPPYKPQVVWNSEVNMFNFKREFSASEKWTTAEVEVCFQSNCLTLLHLGRFHQLLAFSQHELSFYANMKLCPGATETVCS